LAKLQKKGQKTKWVVVFFRIIKEKLAISVFCSVFQIKNIGHT